MNDVTEVVVISRSKIRNQIVDMLRVGLEGLSGRHVKVTDDLVDVNSARDVATWSQKAREACKSRPVRDR